MRYNPWNQDAEAGDYMVGLNGDVWRLVVSNGWGKRSAGELSMRRVKPPAGFKRGELVQGKIHWVV